MKKQKNLELIVTLLISLTLCIYLLGFDNINVINTDWLIKGDLSTHQIGWNFFKNDDWRFPLLSNPNYGIYLNSNLIYSDSIPIFALIFKLIRFILPENFQYFSIWIFLSINLQFYFSFLIIKKFTNDNLFSLIGGLFFITACIFIHRSGIHLSLFGQWIILIYIYFHLDKNHNNQKKYKLYTILVSLLIHFYFTLILIILFISEKIYLLFLKKYSIVIEFLEVSKVLLLSLLLMYFLGYFNIRVDDALGWGYGYYNFNLNSFFNPKGSTINEEVDWSHFLPLQIFQNGEMEGFAYLGLSGIIFFIIFLKYLFLNQNEIIYPKKLLIFLTTIFFLLSVSNNINFGSLNVYEIKLNKYIYALVSIFRASGRLIWPIYYIIFFYGIIHIYKYKNSKILIFLLFVIQIVDISKGLSNYKMGKQYLPVEKIETIYFDEKTWKKLSSKFNELKLLEPHNQSKIYRKLSKNLLQANFLKTDIVYFARISREKIVKKKF